MLTYRSLHSSINTLFPSLTGGTGWKKGPRQAAAVARDCPPVMARGADGRASPTDIFWLSDSAAPTVGD
jgi:hypothetical protein